jgi:acetyl-CoA decarbonylase/synthase complex subunit gamma
LILPQLGAPGVAAHEVKTRSGFRVLYGPIEADDLPSFITSGFSATPEMRTKTFDIMERIVLVPIELISAAKIGIMVLAGLFVLSFLLSGFSLSTAIEHTLVAAFGLGTAILAGAVLAPILLPWLPGKAFSLKGCVTGLLLLTVFFVAAARWWHPTQAEIWALAFSVPAMSAYMAMNFTGCSTFTSLSGVLKETRIALPFEIAGTVAGLFSWIVGLVVGG